MNGTGFSYQEVQKSLIQSLFTEQIMIPKISSFINVDDFNDENCKAVYTALITLTDVTTENKKSITITDIYNWSIENNQPINVELNESLLQSFKIAIRGITTTSTRNNSIMIYPTSCFYADLAQLYIMPKEKGSNDITDDASGKGVKIHRISMQLLSQIYELIKKLHPDDHSALKFQVSSNGFYVYFTQDDLIQIMITQRVTYLDIPDENTLKSIAPSIDDPRIIEMMFDVDEMSKELKMFTNIPSQESKRWGTIKISFDAKKSDRVHLSLYDYVAEVESDFNIISLTFPETFDKYE